MAWGKQLKRPSVLSQERVVDSSEEDDNNPQKNSSRQAQRNTQPRQEDRPRKSKAKLVTVEPSDEEKSGLASGSSREDRAQKANANSSRHHASLAGSSPARRTMESGMLSSNSSHKSYVQSSKTSHHSKERKRDRLGKGGQSFDVTTASEDEVDGSSAENDVNSGEASETTTSTSRNGKRNRQGDPYKTGSGKRQRRSDSQVSASPTTIPAAPFQPPADFTRLHPHTPERIEMFNSFSSGGQEKQLWYFTAPASVPIESLKTLDMNAIISGEPVITHEGRPYTLVAGGDIHELLLPTAEGTYKSSEYKISKAFRLQNPLKEVVKTSLEQNSTAIRFTASSTGDPTPPRQQPRGLRGSFEPFGPRCRPHESIEHQSSRSETTRESSEEEETSEDSSEDSSEASLMKNTRRQEKISTNNPNGDSTSSSSEDSASQSSAKRSGKQYSRLEQRSPKKRKRNFQKSGFR